MDYLIVEGCRDAAEEFAREIGLAEFTATEGAEADQDGMELDGEERVKETFNFEGIEVGPSPCLLTFVPSLHFDTQLVSSRNG